jgi:hypothetical protein
MIGTLAGRDDLSTLRSSPATEDGLVVRGRAVYPESVSGQRGTTIEDS